MVEGNKWKIGLSITAIVVALFSILYINNPIGPIMPPGTAPSAPRNLVTRSIINGTMLSWEAPSDDGGYWITKYDIYRGSSSGAELFLISAGNKTIYNDTGLPPCATYFYKITASNLKGESPFSNEVSIQIKDLPSAPQNLMATSGDKFVNLTWSTPAYTGCDSIIGYYVYRSTTPSNEIFIVTLGNVSDYNDTDVSYGQQYFYKVSAKNSVGEGPLSNEVNATIELPDNPIVQIKWEWILLAAFLTFATLSYIGAVWQRDNPDDWPKWLLLLIGIYFTVFGLGYGISEFNLAIGFGLSGGVTSSIIEIYVLIRILPRSIRKSEPQIEPPRASQIETQRAQPQIEPQEVPRVYPQIERQDRAIDDESNRNLELPIYDQIKRILRNNPRTKRYKLKKDGEEVFKVLVETINSSHELPEYTGDNIRAWIWGEESQETVLRLRLISDSIIKIESAGVQDKKTLAEVERLLKEYDPGVL